MCCDYIAGLSRIFGVSDEAQALFEKVANSPSCRRETILSGIETLRTDVGLAYALLALYRQQVHSGFVLADPLKTEGRTEKEFYDKDTGVTFRVQWNPHRELRKNHALLIERKVIAANVDQAAVVNRDCTGKPCYLCRTNIELQNPGEILLEIGLAEEKFYAGANFAYITNNHYTLMNSEHRPQRYRKKVLEILNDFLDQTKGFFRVIFNGLAGASIEWHEHLQATTEPFPVEQARLKPQDIVHQGPHCTVSQPLYYVPLWVVEGTDRDQCESAADILIRKWQSLNERKHTVNIIAARSEDAYRMFIVLRDKDKLAGDTAGKKGAMAAFETGGNIVLSYKPPPGKDEVNEKRTLDSADLDIVKQLLYSVRPDEQSCRQLCKEISAMTLSL
jgi:hypothetical protein